ncbi:hypothetical protein FQN54_000469 [Arachnomyces sp. PD_36]|nr:hypothetical protein FQN54_000469 [Arachnomyces sp. PD_36]
MQRSSRPDAFDLGATQRTRSQSLSSDLQLSGKSLLLSPPTVRPQPSFIAASAASQIITTDQERNLSEWTAGDDLVVPTGAFVTPASLLLLNGFLDNLLFNILSAAKSTQLTHIRSAISEVLKPRLAKEMVSAADEELAEYMGNGEEEELADFRGGIEPRGEFDLERSWKLARLRCMVYTRLGDMEEEDEDDYIEREGLDDGGAAPSRFSNQSGSITPAAAIFLTSIIEYMGEQALMIAGDAARARLMSTKPVPNDDANSDSIPEQAERLIVDDMDMEKLALNSTLGRLWRTWKKRVRTSTVPRALSRESFVRRGHSSTIASSRKSSICTIEEPPARELGHEPPLAEVQESIDPASIPLPMSENDIDEIEVPGFTKHLAPGINEMRSLKQNLRPRSMVVFPGGDAHLPFLQTENIYAPPIVPRPRLKRHGRSRSLPESGYTVNVIDASDDDFEADFVTPSEERDELVIMNEKGDIAGAVETAPLDPTESDPAADSAEGSSMERDHSVSPELINEEPASGSAEELDAEVHSPETLRVLAMYEPLTVNESTEVMTTHARSTNEPEIPEHLEQQAMEEPQLAQASVGIPVKGASLRNTPSASPTSRSRPRTTSRTMSSGNIPRPPPPPATASPGLERAAVQRVTPPVTPREVSSSKARRSESISSYRDKRPITAGSTTSSKLKGLVARQPSDADRSLQAPLRTSSDLSGRTSGNDDGGGEDSPNLDQLIQSDETIHYTLTPRNMRQIETTEPPQRFKSRSTTNDLAEFLRTTAPPGEEPPRQGSTSNSPRRLNGLRANPPDGSTMKPKSVEIQPSSPGSYYSRNSKSGTTQARDARTNTESVQDFANFIRSTGPPSAPQSAKNAPRHARKLSKGPPNGYQRASFDVGSQKSGSVTRLPQHSESSSSLAQKKPGPRLQARPATLAKGEQTSDLVDFLREGPPVGGASYTPKSVAPVRTTGEEDYHYLGPHVTDRDNLTNSSAASTHDDSTITKSVHSSFNSRTGLIESGNHGNARTYPPKPQIPQPSSHGSVLASKAFVDENTGPVRKQRRVKDPYAIDSDSDEDIDAIMPVSRKPQQKEESLADFLRDCPPPPTVDEPPQLLSVNVPPPRAKSSGSKISTRSAASAMKSRLMRNTSVDKGPSAKLSRTSLRSAKSATTPTGNGAAGSVPSLPMPRSVSPRFVQTGSQMDSYLPPSATSNYSSHVEQQRGAKPTPAPRHPEEDVIMGRIRTETETGALADFLKNTAPPAPPAGLAQDKDSTGSFSRMFTRRKKVGV